MSEVQRRTKNSKISSKTDAGADQGSQGRAWQFVDHLQDQSRRLWLKVRGPNGDLLMSANDVLESDAFFSRLSQIGVVLITNQAKARFKAELQEQFMLPAQESAVAEMPGWLTDQLYIRADGEELQENCAESGAIIAFTGDNRFRPNGDIDEWQAAVGPMVVNQSVILFAMAYALAGALLRFVGSDMTNPILEVVMAPERGKTTLLKFMSSFWGGDPDASLGVGLTLNLTVKSLDRERALRKDSLLCLDESNLAGTGDMAAKFASELVFTLESTKGRGRFGEDAPGDTRVANMITSNTPLFDMVKRDQREAVQSRVVTLRLEKSIFNEVPEGFADFKAASEALAKVAMDHPGVAATHFIQGLLNDSKYGGEGSRTALPALMQRALTLVRSKNLACTARSEKVLALVMVAAHLAERIGTFKTAWGSKKAVLNVMKRIAPAIEAVNEPAETAIAIVQQYLKKNGTVRIVKARKADVPMKAKGYRWTDQNGREWLLISSIHFQRQVPNYQKVVRELRDDAGKAKTEGGAAKKLTIKAPACFRTSARVYCFDLKAIIPAAPPRRRELS